MQKLPIDVLSNIFDCFVEPLARDAHLRVDIGQKPTRARQLSKVYLSHLCFVSKQFNQVATSKLFGNWLIVIDKPAKLKPVLQSARVVSNATHVVLRQRELVPFLSRKKPGTATPKQVVDFVAKCTKLQSLQLELVEETEKPDNQVIKALAKAKWTSNASEFKMVCRRLSSGELRHMIGMFPNLTSLAVLVQDQTDSSKATPLNLPHLRTPVLYGPPKDAVYQDLEQLLDKTTLRGLQRLSCSGFDISKDAETTAETFPELQYLDLDGALGRSINVKWNVDMARLSSLPKLRQPRIFHPKAHQQEVSFVQLLKLLPPSTETFSFENLNPEHVLTEEFAAPLPLEGKKLKKVAIVCDARRHPIHHDSDSFDIYMCYIEELNDVERAFVRSLKRAGIQTAFAWLGHPSHEKEEDYDDYY